jgi:hypothetical protein
MHPVPPDARVAPISEVQIEVRSARLHACEKELRIVPGATQLFEEPGTLEQVAGLASEWFQRHLARDANSRIRQNERDSHVVR